jgi:hypothetical protein
MIDSKHGYYPCKGIEEKKLFQDYEQAAQKNQQTPVVS